MNRITVDTTLRTKLNGLSEPLELCDDSGRVLAVVTPVEDPSQFEALTPDITEEELNRRSQSKGQRYTTAEVLDHLEKL